MAARWRWGLLVLAVIVWTVFLFAPIKPPPPSDVVDPLWRQALQPLAHLISYAVLTILAGWVRVPMKHRLWLLFALCAHGILTELFQPNFGREADVSDAALDMLGIFLGLLLARNWWFGN